MKPSNAEQQVKKALLVLRTQKRTVTFTAVGELAGVSRSTLYRSAALRELIQMAREQSIWQAKEDRVTDLQEQLDALAARTREHEERLRQLENRPHSTKP